MIKFILSQENRIFKEFCLNLRFFFSVKALQLHGFAKSKKYFFKNTPSKHRKDS